MINVGTLSKLRRLVRREGVSVREAARKVGEFNKRTGCPVLVNTSLNVRGEPIVHTPEDAFRCFMGSDIDVLICRMLSGK